MHDIQNLESQFQRDFAGRFTACVVAVDELTAEVPKEQLHALCLNLRDDSAYRFDMLIDICGVDYLEYGASEWLGEESTLQGFSRGVEHNHPIQETTWSKPRFAVVYHLLSMQHNHRIRLRTFIENEPLMVDSVIDIWPAANWFEREAFDLFGVLFNGHPDLRRILTDYGFVGHPFRKDFPLIGNVEMRYDATLGRCVYEPVSIQPRTLVPKVIRHDNRYLQPEAK